MLKWYLIGAALLSLLASVGAVKYLYDQNAKLKTELALKEAQNAETVKQANRYANRPRTLNDTDQRLCAWARKVEQRDTGKPKRGVPVRPCP